MNKHYHFDLSEIDNVAQQLLSDFPFQIYCLIGEMGSGKTTFCSALARALGVQDSVSSPTYALINLYQTSSIKIAHLDLFRIKDIHELQEIGFEDLMDQMNFVWIEWPEIAYPLLSVPYVELTFLKADLHTRSIQVRVVSV